jgi:serine/threonine protein kinase
MVHRDIKPSNILIYRHADDQRLVAKLADFGLAKKNTLDPRKTRNLLRYEDVWKLGTVFAELLTYLSGGPKGVRQFRSFITVTYDQVTSDTFEDIRYDENRVKSEVIEWLRRGPKHHTRGKEVAEITMRMLGTQYECPSAADVAKYLVNVSYHPYVACNPYMIGRIDLKQSSSASFFDGSRFVHFSNAESISGPSMFDKARSFVEKRVGAPIYWWPLPPIQYTCPTGSTRIEWRVGGRDH